MKTVCVIGHPIKHSRSPLIHNYWLKQFNIDAKYITKDIAPENLRNFLETLVTSEFIGCNVTLPHKELACQSVDHLDQRVQRIGALNTIYVRDGKTHATSTDGQGFVANILWHQPEFIFSSAKVVVIGAGGSSRAIIDELLRQGVAEIYIANRTVEKAQRLSQHFGDHLTTISMHDLPKHFANTQLVINTTSAGIANQDKLDLPFASLNKTAVVADINYVPLVTPLLATALAAGFAIVPGLGMLLHQAVRGFELWFGQKPEVDQALYNLVASDIDPDYCP